MPRTLRSDTQRVGLRCRSPHARGASLAAYALAGATVAVGISNVVIQFVGAGNGLDWLAAFLILVLAGGWFAEPVLRWVASRR